MQSFGQHLCAEVTRVRLCIQIAGGISVDDIIPSDFNGDGLTDLAYVKRDKSNVALHVSLAEMSLEAATTNFDWSNDRFAGSYIV